MNGFPPMRHQHTVVVIPKLSTVQFAEANFECRKNLGRIFSSENGSIRGLAVTTTKRFVGKYKPIATAGQYYSNKLFMSKAYQELTPAARNLLQCLISEIRWYPKKSKGGKRRFRNNAEVSLTERHFIEYFGCAKSTYLNARNQLIKNGLIRQTHPGGSCRGDMAKYLILCLPETDKKKRRWREYPQKDWELEIPRNKKNLVGEDTRFKTKPTLKNRTHNGGLHPDKSGSKE